MSDTSDSLQDHGVAPSGGWVCQNEPEHEGGGERKMRGGPFVGVACPECGRMAGHPDVALPYADPPYEEGDIYNASDRGRAGAVIVGEEPFDPEPKNGVYLLGIKSVFEGYYVEGSGDETLVENVTVNGRYIGTSGYFETECDGFELTDDGTLNLRYRGTGG